MLVKNWWLDGPATMHPNQKRLRNVFYLFLFETSSFNYRSLSKMIGISIGHVMVMSFVWLIYFDSCLTTSAAALRSSASPSSLTILPRRFSSQFCFFSASVAELHHLSWINKRLTTWSNEIIGKFLKSFFDLRSCFLYISGFSKPSFGFSIIRLLTRGSWGFSSGFSSFFQSVLLLVVLDCSNGVHKTVQSVPRV